MGLDTGVCLGWKTQVTRARESGQSGLSRSFLDRPGRRHLLDLADALVHAVGRRDLTVLTLACRLTTS